MFALLATICCVIFLAEAKDILTLQPKIVPRFNNPRLVGERIINGDEVPPHSYNFQVAMFIDMEHQQQTGFCGGTLISRKYVLTAGHCIAGAKSVEIIFGAHNINKTEPSQLRMTSDKFKFHEDFIIFFGLNDLVLIELPEEVPLSDEIGIAEFPSLSGTYNSFEGEPATVLGWGYTSNNAGEISDVLRRTDTRIINNEECLESYFNIQPTHICMDCSRHRCPCNGDSGSALIHDGKLIGVVSFGSAMGCSDQHPAAGSRITSFLQWIADNTDVELE